MHRCVGGLLVPEDAENCDACNGVNDADFLRGFLAGLLRYIYTERDDLTEDHIVLTQVADRIGSLLDGKRNETRSTECRNT